MGPWWWMSTRVQTDSVPGLGHCGSRAVARSLAAGGSQVYAYVFAHPSLGSVTVGHGDEIDYVFGAVDHFTAPVDQAMARATVSYWASFAETGSPQPTGLPLWPTYSAAGDASLRLDGRLELGGISVEHGWIQAACDFWDRLSESVVV